MYRNEEAHLVLSFFYGPMTTYEVFSLGYCFPNIITMKLKHHYCIAFFLTPSREIKELLSRVYLAFIPPTCGKHLLIVC